MANGIFSSIFKNIYRWIRITGGTIDNALQGNVKFDHNVETLAANKTLVITDKVIQKLDPDGTDRDVLLPAENTATDLVFFIYNMGGELGEDLYIQNDAAGALETISYKQMGICTCDGTLWKVVCVACVSGADILNLRVKEENTSALVIGQPVYISGATGAAFPNVGLADCDDFSKIRVKGLAAEAISQNSTGYIRVKGLLEHVDSTKGGLINPNSEDWTGGDQLWVARTAGGLTNVRPISGRTIKAGTALTVEASNSKILVDIRENPVFASAASSEDLVLRMGDNGGANKTSYRDYADNEVASVDSDGNAAFTGLKASTDPTNEHGVGDRGFNDLRHDRIPITYVKTMTGNETPAFVSGSRTINHLDPGGADRTFNPTATFPARYEMVIINTGSELVTFDSAGLGQAVGPGQKMQFYYDGSNWF